MKRSIPLNISLEYAEVHHEHTSCPCFSPVLLAFPTKSCACFPATPSSSLPPLCTHTQIGFEFLSRFYPNSKLVLIPTPTWANHRAICERSGLTVQQYRYYKPETRGLDYEVGWQGRDNGQMLRLRPMVGAVRQEHRYYKPPIANSPCRECCLILESNI